MHTRIDPEIVHTPLAGQLLDHVKVSILATVVLAVLVSGIYPVIVWGLAQSLFQHQANGSLIDRNGNAAKNDQDAVGSSLIGQNFSDPKYFHPRPSSAGAGYDSTASGASNLGPTSDKLLNGATKKDDKGAEIVDVDGIQDRIIHYCLDNNLGFDSSMPVAAFQDSQGNLDDVKIIKALKAEPPLIFMPKQPVPADAVTGSGSGLDPHISLANAKIQAKRVSAVRKWPVERVNELIDRCTDPPALGILGEPGVNVLRLNICLEHASASAPQAAIR